MSESKPPTATSGRDDLFSGPTAPAAFRFDASVAAVFPDMISRSVPGYRFNLELVAAIARRHVRSDSRVYDLGCSLGAMTLSIRSALAGMDAPPDRVELIGVDNSPAMLERARAQLAAFHSPYPTDLVCADLAEVVPERASMVVLGYTLQFVDPDSRDAVIESIHDGLLPGGVLVLAEKVHEPDPGAQALMTELHHDFKRANGYSELEIAGKRQALENVLRSETVTAHEQRLRRAGFAEVVMLSRHYGFCLWLARRCKKTTRDADGSVTPGNRSWREET
ncbi:carboxy-S-adenosyl-L-methionine synthase CmoA [Guyparkeria hydrothermalis]|uniref:Carboxy-S-adenosyl-L-methionine synthase n=1 Tax=Guyparkeria halophila TaxID=47960 RepID=A0A6I6DCE4_9GAMM|nr:MULTISPECIES: carboxy-S-adenosyl-L-methionine synthase CmoA [Guyparkeria]MCL7750506.1 carboxy-S-adenosyl-L-methionine synthase CmoA [Guyparkeria hydrothermalis]QGT79492.1 carboxy-S-adenosyl-L-methionine synthase CmoA [Guyparkeria halophila]TKA88934.1 carboxy-S-adenosyl-L-methionine synthase CmoA [Guyparkeria sp. SB14A]